jgi:SAM-dependent MidA family methyltransferase
MTVARFMEIALYDPVGGYYAVARRRSGQAGDFYTSVDVSALFGATLAQLVARTWERCGRPAAFDVVEAGASDGRLARDVLDTLSREAPDAYDALRLTLVERSATARAIQAETLRPHASRLQACRADLPETITGLLYANELLDAFPVHRIRMTSAGLRETYVEEHLGTLTLVEGPPSTPRLQQYLDTVGVPLEPGARTDVSLTAVDWCRQAARLLRQGYLLLIDYGYEATRLHDSAQGGGTLRAYIRHLVDAPAAVDRRGADGAAHPRENGRATPAAQRDPDACPPWLLEPGGRDLTAHVDFTATGIALTQEGLVRETFVDQTRFLLALGLMDQLRDVTGSSLAATRRRLAARALIAPDGLGSTHRALLARTRDVPALDLPFDAPWTA